MSRPSQPPESHPPPVLSEEELAYRGSVEKLVDWYRVRQSRALAKAFLPGLVLLPLGSSIVALSMARLGLPESIRPLLTALGVLVTAGGPVWAVWQLFRAIRGDLYVAIRVDGLAVRLDPGREERLVTWDSLREVQHDLAEGVLRVELEGEPPLLVSGLFEGISLVELGSRIRDARRLAVWNRLLPRYPAAKD